MRFKVHGTFAAAAVLSVTSGAWAQPDRSHYPCPRSCSEFPRQADWSTFHTLDGLAVCGESVLLTLNPFTPVNDPSYQFRIRACTTGNADTSINAMTGTPARLFSGNPGDHDSGRIARRDEADDVNSGPPVCRQGTSTNTTSQWLTWSTPGGSSSNEEMIASLKDTQAFLGAELNCGENIIYGRTRDALIGVYVGHGVQNSAVASGFIQNFIDRLAFGDASAAERVVSQVCGNGRNSDYHLGVVADPSGDLAWVQNATRTWAEARCVDQGSSETFLTARTFPNTLPTIPSEGLHTNHTPTARALSHGASCRRKQAVYGDTAESLASACGIGTDDLRSYNNLAINWRPEPYQWVCCSKGALARRDVPGPRPDGTCASYVTVNDDGCSKIANTYGITTQDLYTYNKQTWGWGGCNNLFPGMRICLGPGTPRLPATNPDAECGPSKPGTQSPSSGTKIEDLSPCNIKACCNIWGKCGVDEAHCIPTKSETGNPGTAEPRTNGCVQNCGLEMTNNGSPPASFMKVAYFEAWNRERPCLHMSVSQIPSSYTHVHYAFVDITESFGVSTGRFADVFAEFKALKGPKRVISFGGWAFSTEPSTYHLFRNAVKPGNRNQFAQACVDFVVSNNLDGVDFDWEYPAEPDITPELIPPGDPEESENYLEFVKAVKAKMPAGKTVSIAAPASYWYLKQFLIEEMSQVLDYIIYMTYDLHGQWDYGNKWAQVGCSGGNCLRSHVNMTETMSALVMITKAGVSSDKVVVGVSSYGRSFEMTSASCTGPLCTYTGPESGAEHGRCTETGGYISDGEIRDIVTAGRASRQWKDDSETDYIVYDNNWVAYMDESNKKSRTEKYRSLNFRGTTDWAIDLQGNTGDDNSSQVVYLNDQVYSGTPAQCTPPCLFVLAPSGLPLPTTIDLPAYTTSIEIVPGTTTTVTIQAPPLTVSSMQYSNVPISSGQTTSSFEAPISLDVPPITTTITAPGGVVFTTIFSLPPWPAISHGPDWNASASGQPGGQPVITITPPLAAPTPKPPVKTDPTTTGVAPGSWPTSMELTPVPEDIPDEGEDDDGDGSKSKTTCKLWFFFICVKWDDFGIRIGGWEWNLPVGVWGPGPPAIDLIKLPPGLSIKGTLPPWPKITVFPGGKISPPPKPADCTPVEASICMTTSSFGTTVTGGTTKTTATQVKSTCAPIMGCDVEDDDTTTSADACSLRARTVMGRAQMSQATGVPGLSPAVQARASRWDCEQFAEDGIIWPASPSESGQKVIRDVLEERKQALGSLYGYHEIRADDLDFTAFYFVENLGPVAIKYFQEKDEIWRAFNFRPEMKKAFEDHKRKPGQGKRKREPRGRTMDAVANVTEHQPATVQKRATQHEVSKMWHLSQISIPPRVEWNVTDSPHVPSQEEYAYYYDDAQGSGQTIYIMEEDIQPGGGEFPSQLGPRLEPHKYNKFKPIDENVVHGTIMAAMAGGIRSGLARKAELVLAPTQLELVEDHPIEFMLESLVAVANDIKDRKKPKDSTVVNMSWGVKRDWAQQWVWDTMTLLMTKIEDKYGTVFVAASGNADTSALAPNEDPGNFEERDTMPYEAFPHMKGMMVVGATTKEGIRRPASNVGNYVEVYAPGHLLPVPLGVVTNRGNSGTSPAAALVSGLVACLRSNPTYSAHQSPAQVKLLIRQLARAVTYQNVPNGPKPPVIYNGQSRERSCLPERSLNDASLEKERRLSPRQADDACPLPGNGGRDEPRGPTVTFRPGPPGPLCTVASSCGKLCTASTCAGVGLLPSITLPPVSTSTGFGSMCRSTTTFRQCNGSPHGGACITTSSCALYGLTDTDALTLPSTTAPYSPPGGSCVSSTTWSELGGPKFEATITKSSCASWSTKTPTPTHTATTTREQEPTTKPSPTTKPEPTRCIMARSRVTHDGSTFHDGVRAQVWDNGKPICDEGQGLSGLSDDSEFNFGCGGGAWVYTTQNGRILRYTAADGWEGELDVVDVSSEAETCAIGPNGGNVKCTQTERVFRNGQCDDCPLPVMCGSARCKYDPTCG